MIDDVKKFDAGWLDGIENLGVTSGASTPDYLVDKLLQKIREQIGSEDIEITEV